MRIQSIRVTGEMGDFEVIRMNEKAVGVYRLRGQDRRTDESLITSSLDELAVAIDGVGFADQDGCEDLAQLLAVKLEGL